MLYRAVLNLLRLNCVKPITSMLTQTQYGELLVLQLSVIPVNQWSSGSVASDVVSAMYSLYMKVVYFQKFNLEKCGAYVCPKRGVIVPVLNRNHHIAHCDRQEQIKVKLSNNPSCFFYTSCPQLFFHLPDIQSTRPPLVMCEETFMPVSENNGSLYVLP